MKSLRVGFDLDGVLYSFTKNLRAWMMATTGKPASAFPTPKGWSFYESWGFASPEEFTATCDLAADAGFLFRWGPITGLDVICRLKTAGHSIHLVTARGFGKLSEANTRRWLADHQVPYDSLTFSRDKTVVPLDFYVDDHPRNVDACLAAGINAWCLYEHPRTDQRGHPRLITSLGIYEEHINWWANR